MNITKNTIDDLNAVITVIVGKNDYADKVDETIKKLRKTADIKGFRKGQVPVSFIKKQYEKGIVYDEVNKILQQSLNDYIQDEKISLLGNPIPTPQDDIDWDADELKFDFEIGLAPEFELNLDSLKIEHYKIDVDDAEIDKYVNNFADRYGSYKPVDSVEKDSTVKVSYGLTNDEEPSESYIDTKELSDFSLFEGKKAGDEITINSNGLLKTPEDTENIFGLEPGEAVELKLKIESIEKHEPAAVDNALFDTIYGEGRISSLEEFRAKIKEESEKLYEGETEKFLFNNILDNILADTTFELPSEFLQKWLLETNADIETPEIAKSEYDKIEKSLRYQLIESKLAEVYDIKVDVEDVKAEAKGNLKKQFAMYGQLNLTEDMLENFSNNILSNEEEVNKLSRQVFNNKLLTIFKENVKINEKEVTFDEFLEVVNPKKEEIQS